MSTPVEEARALHLRAQQAVAGLHLLEIMAYLERHGWGYRLHCTAPEGCPCYWRGSVWREDGLRGTTGRQDSNDSPAEALRGAFTRVVMQRHTRRAVLLAQNGLANAAALEAMPTAP